MSIKNGLEYLSALYRNRGVLQFSLVHENIIKLLKERDYVHCDRNSSSNFVYLTKKGVRFVEKLIPENDQIEIEIKQPIFKRINKNKDYMAKVIEKSNRVNRIIRKKENNNV
jgi:hypothetical protein